MKQFTLYNTRSRSIETFHPISPPQVGMYTCGPTVYHYQHIGNLRTYVFQDILKRTLLSLGYTINHVMNITDVGHLTDDGDDGEDKMEKGSRREGKTAWQIAEQYTEIFRTHIEALNILPPDTWCKATDHIPEQIDQVQILIDRGYAYETDDGIYFDTSRFPRYGELASLDTQSLKAGIRVAQGQKKNPHDFALWKFSAPDETRQMEWDAFGKKGFPGWHIECSAMAMKYLGDHFDIHCGGIDHIPVHHTNEIAQAESAGAHHPWVNYWLHGEFLLTNDEKMSKSQDNFTTLDTLIAQGYPPLAYRYFLLQAHYRKQLTFSWEALDSARTGLNNLYRAVDELGDEDGILDTTSYDAFLSHIYHDLNTPQALAEVQKILKSDLAPNVKRATIHACDQILGLNLTSRQTETDIPDTVTKLLKKRAKARENKEWDKSDALRNEIRALGFDVEDNAGGQQVRKTI